MSRAPLLWLPGNTLPCRSQLSVCKGVLDEARPGRGMLPGSKMVSECTIKSANIQFQIRSLARRRQPLKVCVWGVCVCVCVCVRACKGAV